MVGTMACCLLVVVLSVWPGIALRTAESADPFVRQARAAIAAGPRVEPVAASSHLSSQSDQPQKGGG